MILDVYKRQPYGFGVGLLVVILLLFLADAGVTINSMLKLKRKLKLMNDIAGKLRLLSDNMGQNISSSVEMMVRAGETAKTEYAEYKANADQLRAELKVARNYAKAGISDKLEQSAEELRAKYAALLEKQSYTQRRLLKAFPNLTQGRNKEIIEKWKEYWRKKGRF